MSDSKPRTKARWYLWIAIESPEMTELLNYKYYVMIEYIACSLPVLKNDISLHLKLCKPVDCKSGNFKTFLPLVISIITWIWLLTSTKQLQGYLVQMNNVHFKATCCGPADNVMVFLFLVCQISSIFSLC